MQQLNVLLVQRKIYAVPRGGFDVVLGSQVEQMHVHENKVRYAMGVRMKTCAKCGKTKDIELFYRQRTGKDGRNARCIDCIKEDVKNSRQSKVMGKFPESHGVSSEDEERIEVHMIDVLQQLQNQYNVDIYTSIRAGLVDRFSVIRRVQK